jgi:hypothetical protein
MSQELIFEEIAKDIQLENTIIEKHKKKQVEILKQITDFKSNMQSQISVLENSISEINTEVNNVKLQKTKQLESSTGHLEDLNKQIEELKQKNENIAVTTQEKSSSSEKELTTLSDAIDIKKTKIIKLQEESISKIEVHKSVGDILKLHKTHLTELIVECEAIQGKIAAANENFEKVSIFENDHQQLILSNVEILKKTTEAMKIELESDSQLLTDLNEK